MPRRGWVVLGVVLVAPVALGLWNTFAPEQTVGRDGSDRIGEGRPLVVDDPAESYRILYLEESGAGGAVVTNTRELWVERPFSSRVEERAGAPPGEERRSFRVSTFGLLVNESEGGGRTEIATPPTIASSDLRPDPVLEAAVEAGLVERRERRRVHGRECQVYRFGGPVSAGELTPPDDGPEHTDACFDDRGLLLEEHWTDGEEVLRRRVAIDVEVDPDLPDEIFGDRAPEELGEGAGSVTRIGEEPAGTWRIEPPRGFRFEGAYDVRFPPDAIPPQATFGAPRTRTDVWVDGIDVLVVDQGASLFPLVSQEGGEEGRPVELGEGLDARLLLDLRTSELRVATPDDSLVRIFGTFSPSDIAGIGETLRSAEEDG